jgi:hypothetical protein
MSLRHVSNSGHFGQAVVGGVPRTGRPVEPQSVPVSAPLGVESEHCNQQQVKRSVTASARATARTEAAPCVPWARRTRHRRTRATGSRRRIGRPCPWRTGPRGPCGRSSRCRRRSRRRSHLRYESRVTAHKQRQGSTGIRRSDSPPLRTLSLFSSHKRRQGRAPVSVSTMALPQAATLGAQHTRED